jgi:hypothetical protein
VGIRNRLELVYARVPVLRCKGLCQDTCGPIPAAREEVRLMERAAGRAHGWQLATGQCTLLDEGTGRCACYRDRPLVCRAWGTVESSACPFGCEPDRWLTQQQFNDLQARVADVAGPPLHPRPFAGARAATTEEYRRSTEAASAVLERGFRLPDRWDAAQSYVICPACRWRGQSDAPDASARFLGHTCPHCGAGVLRLAESGDRPLFVPKPRV